jgi:hypothetical protein
MLAIGEVSTENPAETFRKGRAHLYAGPFAAQRKTSADRQQTPDEFDGNQDERSRWQFAAQHRLDVRDAASCGVLTETTHQPGAAAGGRRRANDHQRAAKKRPIRPPAR